MSPSVFVRLLLPISVSCLSACSIRRRRKACLFGIYFLCVFVFNCVYKAILILLLYRWMSFQCPPPAQSSPQSPVCRFQRRMLVSMRSTWGMTEARIRASSIWQAQVSQPCRVIFHGSLWCRLTVKMTLCSGFPHAGYEAVMNEVFRVIGEWT